MAALTLFIGTGAAADIQEALIGYTGIDSLAERSEALDGIDVRQLLAHMLRGDIGVEMADVRAWLTQFGSSLREALTEVLVALAGPVLLSLIMKALLAERAGGSTALLCRVGCAALLMSRFSQAREMAEQALAASSNMVGAAAPVVAVALTLTGDGRIGSILTPAAALCADLMESLLSDIALPLCGVTAALAASAGLSARFRLNRLFDLLCRAVTWGVRLMMAGFMGLMALEGLLAGPQEALSARVLSRALRAAIPVIGSEVSDSAGALLTTCATVRNAVGVAGLLAVLGVAAAPIAKLAIQTIALKLAGAVLEPVADEGVTGIIGRFGDVTRLLMAVCAGGAVLGALTLGAALGLAAL